MKLDQSHPLPLDDAAPPRAIVYADVCVEGVKDARCDSE